MFTKVSKYMNKVVSYPSNLLSAIAMAAMVFIVIAVVVSVLARWLFDSPVKGTWDLASLAFSMVVWGSMAVAAFKGGHVALTVVLERLPRLARLITELIIALVTSGTLGVLCWRLVAHGIRLGETLSRTGVLRIPYEPFLYFAASGCAVFLLVFLARIPGTIGKIRGEQ
jgi:TRAP-type C4-dicarboxylate transport system permease small subunit